ncbi:hypothetical protein ABPG73_022921 [Tetrahymena malaccensis]
MSIRDLQIETTRYNQGQSIKSKDWELVRNKVFEQDEDILWNDSQLKINEVKEKTLNLIQILQKQDNFTIQDIEEKCQKQMNSSQKSQNTRRLNLFSKKSSSRTRTIELETSNINETTIFNQIQREVSSREYANILQGNKQNANKINKIIELNKLFFKMVSLITKVKLKMINFYQNYTSIQRSRLLSRDIRMIINDQSEGIDDSDNLPNGSLRCLNKNSICQQLQIPLFSISSKTGFYMKLILVLTNIVYLFLLSIFMVFQVDDEFSKSINQIINLVWLIDILYSFNSQTQEGTEIITERKRAMLTYIKKKLIFDIIPFALNTHQFEELQAQVNLYLQQYYQNNFFEEQRSNQLVLDKLPADLQDCLKREQFKSLVPQINFLFNYTLSIQTIEDLTLFMQEEFYLPNQKLNLSGDQSLLFITQGQLTLFQNEEQEFSNKCDKGVKLNIGQHFGLIDFISGISSQNTAKSSMFTKIVKINREDFLKVVQKNEIEYQKFCELKDRIQFYQDFTSLNLKCSICKSFYHLDKDCNLININRKQIYYKQQINQHEQQKRIPFKRLNLKNYNPLIMIQRVNEQAQDFIDNIKKQKEIEIIELLDLTVSDTENSQFEERSSQSQQDHQQEEQQQDYQSQKYSQNTIQQKQDLGLRKQSTLGKSLAKRQSFKDLDEQQKGFDSIQILKYDFSSDRVISNEPYRGQNSQPTLNDNQIIAFKDYDRINKCHSEDKIDIQNFTNQNKKQQTFSITQKDLQNQKFIKRLSAIFENPQESSQKQLVQKQFENSFKLLSQIFVSNNNNNNTNNSNNNINNNNYDFDLHKDFESYFVFGNLKEILLRLQKQVKKKLKRAQRSFYVPQKN